MVGPQIPIGNRYIIASPFTDMNAIILGEIFKITKTKNSEEVKGHCQIFEICWRLCFLGFEAF